MKPQSRIEVRASHSSWSLLAPETPTAPTISLPPPAGRSSTPPGNAAIFPSMQLTMLASCAILVASVAGYLSRNLRLDTPKLTHVVAFASANLGYATGKQPSILICTMILALASMTAQAIGAKPFSLHLLTIVEQMSRARSRLSLLIPELIVLPGV